jgi:hypothetical protein
MVQMASTILPLITASNSGEQCLAILFLNLCDSLGLL